MKQATWTEPVESKDVLFLRPKKHYTKNSVFSKSQSSSVYFYSQEDECIRANCSLLYAQVSAKLLRLRVRMPGMCCSETKILTRFFSPNFPRGHVVSGVGFSALQGSDDIITVHKFETEGRLEERKESEISYLPRGLANSVEPQRSLRVESPIGRAAGRKESVRSIS